MNAHPDKFKISSTPAVGAIFSCIGRNHVGIVIGWDGTNITIQEGNLDGKTNSFAEAKKKTGIQLPIRSVNLFLSVMALNSPFQFN